MKLPRAVKGCYRRCSKKCGLKGFSQTSFGPRPLPLSLGLLQLLTIFCLLLLFLAPSTCLSSESWTFYQKNWEHLPSIWLLQLWKYGGKLPEKIKGAVNHRHGMNILHSDVTISDSNTNILCWFDWKFIKELRCNCEKIIWGVFQSLSNDCGPSSGPWGAPLCIARCSLRLYREHFLRFKHLLFVFCQTDLSWCRIHFGCSSLETPSEYGCSAGGNSDWGLWGGCTNSTSPEAWQVDISLNSLYRGYFIWVELVRPFYTWNITSICWFIYWF